MALPFKQAKNFHAGRISAINLIVVHDMEAPEKATTAESVASYFAGRNAPMASAHVCIDSDSEVQCVRYGDTAFHAPGVNSRSIGLEHAGYARQSRAEWLDPYGLAMLTRSARLVAELCRQFHIPARRLNSAEVRAGAAGICGHIEVTRAFPGKGSHTDPGAGFPWDVYMGLLAKAMGAPLASVTQGPIIMPYDPSQPAFLVYSGSPEEAFLRAYVKGAKNLYQNQKLSDYQIIAFPKDGARPSPIPPYSVGVGTHVPEFVGHFDQVAGDDRFDTLHRLLGFLGV